MKVNFDEVLIDPKGKPFQDNSKLADAAYAALSQALPTDAQMPLDKKRQLYRLLQRVGAGGEQEVSVEEVAEIKDRVAKLFPLAVFGAVENIFESAKVSSMPKAVEEQKSA